MPVGLRSPSRCCTICFFGCGACTDASYLPDTLEGDGVDVVLGKSRAPPGQEGALGSLAGRRRSVPPPSLPDLGKKLRQPILL